MLVIQTRSAIRLKHLDNFLLLKIMKNTRITVVLFVLTGVILSGCANVAPWERGILAKPQMALDPHPLQSTIRAHNYGSREAAASPHSAGGGGGCGCF